MSHHHLAEELLPVCEVRQRSLCHLQSRSLSVSDCVLDGGVVIHTLRSPWRSRPRNRRSFFRRFVDCRLDVRRVPQASSYFWCVKVVDGGVVFLWNKCSCFGALRFRAVGWSWAIGSIVCILGLIVAPTSSTSSTLLRSRVAITRSSILALQATGVVNVASAPSAMTATFLAVSASGHLLRRWSAVKMTKCMEANDDGKGDSPILAYPTHTGRRA